MVYRPMSPVRGGAWTKVVIFVSLYVLLLQSLIEWALVLFLYGSKHVDSKMAPSLIIALIGSFFTVPLVILHSFLAWQYNRVIGYASQKTMLHTACTYILRLTTTIWLAASVAGMVVVSQQAYCLPDSANGGFWKVGVSCALHRAVVIVSVLSFLTLCLYFCSRELCERPYDVSLLGVYKHGRSTRDDSTFSSSSSRSEKSLKNDILCVCRRPDVTYGRTPYMASSDDSEKLGYPPDIQQPTPIRPTSFLHFGTDPDAEAEYLSGTTATPSAQSDFYPLSISRTPSAATSQTVQTYSQVLPELPGGPGAQHAVNHTRGKSSLSSLRRFLPKSLPVSIPLSADPQIRALAESSAHVDLEKQEPQKEETPPEKPTPPIPPTKNPQPPPKDDQPRQSSHLTQESMNNPLPRSTTMNSADAPEVVPPAPRSIRRSNTTHTAPSSHTGNPNPGSWATLLDPNQARPMRMNTMRVPRRQSQFDSHHIPRYTQSQRYSGGRNRYSRQFRRNDAELIYQHQGLRRPCSTTFSSMSIVSVPGHLDCIRETGTSIDELRPGADRKAGSTQGH